MATPDESRRGKVTLENQLEAKKLFTIYLAKADLREKNGATSQSAFGHKYEIGNQAAVGHFLNGKTALSMKAALGFCRGLECTLDDFTPRLAATARAEVAAMQVGLGGPAPWPFALVDQEKFTNLSEMHRHMIEGAMLSAAGQIHVDIEKRAA